MKNKLHILLIVLNTFLVSSCDIFNGTSPLTFVTKQVNINEMKIDDSVYVNLQKELFDASCIRCHNPEAAAKKSRLDLTNKTVVQENLEDILRRVTMGPEDGKGQMPPRGDRVDPLLIERLKEWGEDPIFANLKVNLFEASCIQCHNPKNSRRMDFTTKENIITYFDEAFYRMGEAFEDKNRPMPPIGKGKRVSKNLVDQYEAWFNSQSHE